jgi:hypothetical protein
MYFEFHGNKNSGPGLARCIRWEAAMFAYVLVIFIVSYVTPYKILASHRELGIFLGAHRENRIAMPRRMKAVWNTP